MRMSVWEVVTPCRQRGKVTPVTKATGDHWRAVDRKALRKMINLEYSSSMVFYARVLYTYHVKEATS